MMLYVVFKRLQLIRISWRNTCSLSGLYGAFLFESEDVALVGVNNLIAKGITVRLAWVICSVLAPQWWMIYAGRFLMLTKTPSVGIAGSDYILVRYTFR